MCSACFAALASLLIYFSHLTSLPCTKDIPSANAMASSKLFGSFACGTSTRDSNRQIAPGLHGKSGRLPTNRRAKTAGAAVERAWRGLLWEDAPAQANEHPVVHELVPSVSERDLRQSDVFVRGMSIGNGGPVAVDMCMGSALEPNGTPYAESTTTGEATIRRLTAPKREK